MEPSPGQPGAHADREVNEAPQDCRGRCNPPLTRERQVTRGVAGAIARLHASPGGSEAVHAPKVGSPWDHTP